MAQRNKKIKVYNKKRSSLKTFFKVFFVCVLLACMAPLALFLYYIKDLPRPDNFQEGIMPQSTKIYDRTGDIVLYEIAGEEKRTLISLREIPQFTKDALIATEDRQFFSHPGFNIKSIIRAALFDLKLQTAVQGASTISQQLIRSYFLTQNKTIKRKTRELLLTYELERRYEKEQILEWYFNLIPFGSNIYGIEAASQYFFNKTARDISLEESALLVALIKSPTRLSPFGENQKELLRRKDFVLDNIAELGLIDKESAQKAKVKEIKFFPPKHTFKAPHFVMFIKEFLEKKYTREYLNRAGLKVVTTLDFALQEKAEKIVGQGVKDALYANAHNGALIALNPKTGELLAMVGSKDYFATSSPNNCLAGKTCLFDPQVNVSTSQRQPGSSFKPFVYALAFLKGYTPQTHIWDVFTEFNYNCPGSGASAQDKYGQKCYHPFNYDGLFKGQITLKNALAQSRNVPAVKTLYLADVKETLDFAKDFGITTLKDESNYGLALVLGGGEVKLLEMTLGYAVFANDGARPNLNFIKEIQDKDGKIIERINTSTIKIIPSQIARAINDILSDNEARAPMFGWNSALYLGEQYPAAVKTGTTQEYKDAWTIGYTPNLVVGAWVGNNDNTPMTRASASIAAPLWKNFMLEVLPALPKESFAPPQKQTTDIAILDGQFLGNHSILYYLNKKNPLAVGTSRNDPQFNNWEAGVANWLGGF